MTHHSLWFIRWITTHLMLQAWFLRASFSHPYWTTPHDTNLITCNQAHSRGDMCGLKTAVPSASWMPLVAIVGLKWALLDLHCLALYWHGGIDSLDVLHVSIRDCSHSGLKTHGVSSLRVSLCPWMTEGCLLN